MNDISRAQDHKTILHYLFFIGILGQCKEFLTIDALNSLKFPVCYINNSYIITKCQENIWTMADPEFGFEQRKGRACCKSTVLNKVVWSIF